MTKTIRIGLLGALVFLAATGAAQGQSAKLSCSGSEPFWSLAIAGDRARFQAANPELAGGGSDFTGKATAVANHRPATSVWRGRSASGQSDLVALIVPLECGLPSGDKVPYRVRLSLPDGAALTGCCN